MTNIFRLNSVFIFIYGYAYYFIFNLFLVSLSLSLFRLLFLNDITQKTAINTFTKLFISKMIFLLLITFTALNYILDFYSETIFILFNNLNFQINSSFNKLLNTNALTNNIADVYVYPFIYIFLLITVLSILFCIVYNTDEIFTFMFYCQLILIAGYTLFFTDSLILFFISYEMLLLPSFFILYKFAKTRRCVEASYLMFF